ncbi:hypothetical protein CBR_g60258 [Chara braunii]|uniref:Uncharacterized protein n=1 Tax=Chara braunii TaxID=69332 RepID=A0A388MF97_CHABU|nr:hypothetical protein CBR_g60258 [Chara braunii]|eukprot:GBG93193.1 hypothetical protein CBR_g60258 [Chara braunii]
MRLASLGAWVTVVDTSDAGGTETVRLIEEITQKREKDAQAQADDGHAAEASKAGGGRTPRAIFVKCDVARPGQLAQAFAAHVNTFKRLDVVVNNAGIANELNFAQPQSEEAPPASPDLTKLKEGGGPPLMRAEVDARPWSRMIDVNLKAVVDGVRLAVECMGATAARSKEEEEEEEEKEEGAKRGEEEKESRAKRVIINVASIAGLVAHPPLPVYSATKAAVVMLSRCLGHLESELGIRVCAFCPSAMDTPLARSIAPAIIQALPDFGGYLPVETAVDGMMKLITDEGNGGSVMKVNPREGCSYVTFDDHILPR